LLADVERLAGRLDDAADVFVFLRRKADHEVELHVVPAAGEDALGRVEQVLLGHVLVHDVAHALRAGLRREREPGRAHLAHAAPPRPMRRPRPGLAPSGESTTTKSDPSRSRGRSIRGSIRGWIAL